MVMGFAAAHDNWLSVIREMLDATPHVVAHGLGGTLELCVFDNRGIGRSTVPAAKTAYTAELLAADALALMVGGCEGVDARGGCGDGEGCVALGGWGAMFHGRLMKHRVLGWMGLLRRVWEIRLQGASFLPGSTTLHFQKCDWARAVHECAASRWRPSADGCMDAGKTKCMHPSLCNMHAHMHAQHIARLLHSLRHLWLAPCLCHVCLGRAELGACTCGGLQHGRDDFDSPGGAGATPCLLPHAAKHNSGRLADCAGPLANFQDACEGMVCFGEGWGRGEDDGAPRS
eukprot:364639-Chlamydomonas_euryale.AAC.59